MYGWRAKVGHISASRGDSLVYEFYRMMPEGFLLMNTTGRIRKLADDHIKNQMDFIEDASIDLEQSGADVVIASGSPQWTLMGKGARSRPRSEFRQRSKFPLLRSSPRRWKPCARWGYARWSSRRPIGKT